MRSGEISELLFLREFFAPSYPQLAMLVGLLLVAIYRPERIFRIGMFRLSCVLLALSFLATPIATAVVTTMTFVGGGRMGRSGNADELILLFPLLQISDPLLVALSICLGIFSLLPRSGEPRRSGPAQHPLEP
jgi:hypothetical protein